MYRLSNYIELVTENEKGTSKHYVVMVNKRNKTYLINEAILEFLNAFKSPITFENVCNSFAKTTKARSRKDIEALESNLQQFFDQLLKRQWIVEADKVEDPIENRPLFKTKEDFLNYKVLRILGNKKLTDVYLVKDTKTNQRLVVKLLNKKKFKNEKTFNAFLPHFKAEYQFLKTFNSIYINKTLGFKSYKDNPCILLKYEQGISLNKFINTTFVSTQNKIKLVSKILKAFSIIHKHQVFHGDIHFSNILINKNKQPRIIDFGYSNHVEDVKKELKDLRNGGVYGFIPPERAIRSLDHRFTKVEQYQSEVYQISVVIYFVFVKQFPFKAETWKAMVDEKLAFNIETHTPFMKRRMPLLVRDFIIKGLQKDPEMRFKDAKHMLTEWQKVKHKL